VGLSETKTIISEISHFFVSEKKLKKVLSSKLLGTFLFFCLSFFPSPF